jgi:membrane-associated phospholipid phosphatase
MDDTRERPHLAGSIVRAIILIALVVVVAPAVVADGDVLAMPAVALVLLAAIAVAVVGLVYWLVTVGAAAGWLARHARLSPDRVVIGGATALGLVATAGLAWFRFELDRQHSSLSQFDLRAAATAARLSNEHGLMLTLNMAGIRSMLVLGVTLVVGALAAHAFRSAGLLAATMALGGGLVEILKTKPSGPLPTLGAVARSSTSWPSGHAALQCSVAFGVVLWWWAAGLPRPTIVAAVVFPAAVVVGYSRAYLGLHFLSEIFAGWCVAAIAAAVVVVIDRRLATRLTLLAPPKRWPLIATCVAAVVLTVAAVQTIHRLHNHGPARPSGFVSPFVGYAGSARSFPPTQLRSDDLTALLDRLPRFTSTLLGRRGQPPGLVVVADDTQLETAIAHAGWTPATVFSPRHLASEFWAGLTGGAARDAPFAPTFFDTRAADAVIEHPAGRGTQTHQADLWQLPFVTPSGCPVWVLTASLDQRTAWTWRTLFPERRIAPTIDIERDALARALAATGRLHDLGDVRFGAPTRGSTPAGPYTTDGRVALLREPGC